MEAVWQSVVGLMTRGGIAMWPLLALSLVAVSVSVERVWFFVSQNHRGELKRVQKLADRLRRGDRSGAEALVEGDCTVYGRAASVMLANGLPCGEAATAEAVEGQRGRLERYLPLLSTIITAAPMLGILGTVIGIITSFEALGGPGLDGGADGAVADPRVVSSGIAEALLSTAAGLTVSLIALFPFNAFRAQVDRTMSRLEMLGVSAELAAKPAESADEKGATQSAPSSSAPAGKA